MLLGVKTDGPVAELYLYGKDGVLRGEMTWEAGRELAHGLLRNIDDFLAQRSSSFEALEGLFVFKGPGSFTGLRIGITVMNTLAYAESVPIVGTNGAAWRTDAVQLLAEGVNHQVVMPEYGTEARITQPRK